ncbi:MAG TPA: LTA synthase family protein [Stellaceae bacterium]|nr:LTA synthase family protein [Stellaceae bacterium]
MLHLAAGAALALGGWLFPRHIAGASWASWRAVVLDAAPFTLGAVLLGLATGRPLFAGVIIAALGAGFALADYTMRETLHEPVVFSESVELPQLFTHPHLYLPFAGPGLVIGGALGAAAAAVGLLFVEPSVWTPRPLAALAVVAAIGGFGWLGAREPLLGALGAAMRRFRPSGDAYSDATAFGPFGSIAVHTIIARAERAERHRALGLAAPPIIREVGDAAVPIIIVQCESFFDARRLSALVPRDFLGGFDACCASAARYGRLEVPGWGANTMRAEFAVLSGVPESALGYDRFNPYYALARVPLESQVWRLRRAGYRTVCLHPFDPRFFRRDLVMPALGFEQFLGREAFGAPNRPPFCSDQELAGHILRVLDDEGGRSFLFAITMGNHGPWLGTQPPLDPAVARLFDPADVPNGAELLRYLDGVRRSDEMLQILVDGLRRRGSPALLAFYGDHLPSLSASFRHFGFDEPHSDYVIWPGAASIKGATSIKDGAPVRQDLPSHELGRLVVDMALAPAAGEAADRSACLAPS